MDQKPTTIAEHFDRMILPHASGDDTAADGRRRLALRKAPERRLLPMLHRQMSQVDPRLVAVFRKLIAGEAAWPLFVHGDVGTGKTLAALSLADFATTASYWTVESLCDCIMDPNTHVGSEWERIAKKELAVLDELGERAKVGDLRYTAVKKHLDQREQHAGRVAVYLSNLNPNGLVEIYDRRIVSRLTAGTTVELTGRDRRGTK